MRDGRHRTPGTGQPGRMPGVGQFQQRRWAAGAVFLLAFLASLCALVFEVAAPLRENLDALMAFADVEANREVWRMAPGRIEALLGVTFLVYVVSVADVWVANRRVRRERDRVMAAGQRCGDGHTRGA